ncbi:membrane protein insertase YidC [Niveispirillum irakense]|uniref:membrane protein insertase YidC n=1 Tax=Niveispirillum irakense TaxID=34011 RepID=UPI000426A008|nr:membrane protein insertase YidC [Niveispirillum irakense]
MTDQKNLILTIAISVAILFGFHFFYERPRQQAAQAELQRQQALQVEQGQVPSTVPQAGTIPGASDGMGGAARERGDVLAENARVRVNTPSLHGSINLRGGRIDDLTLAKYNTTPEKGSPEVVLLSPLGGADPYFAEFGWLAAGGPAVNLPKSDSIWTASADTLTPGNPITLTFDNGEGLVFERTIAVDENYMFTITERVRNESGSALNLQPYGFVQRRGAPHTSGMYILHEGPLGVLDGTLKEFKYKDLKEDGKTETLKSTGGWIGITDKYWLVSLIPDQSAPIEARVLHQQVGGDLYQVDFRGTQAITVAPGSTAENTSRLFAGAKVVSLLDEYSDKLNIADLNYAIDWGWFYFLTIPFFHALDFLGRMLGNFGLAILAFTVVLRLAFFPIANKQFEAFAKMKKLQPKMEELKKKHGDNREALSMAMMKLYREEKANPLAGCLPILLQIPVFFALYKVLYVTIEMRHAPFYGWINDLSAPDPTTLFNLFGLIPWDPPSFLHIGILPLLMGITMWLQQKMNPSNPDPVQQKVFMLLPLIFTYMMASFPAGLVIYWTWSNLLSILQQWVIMRRMGVKPT